MKKRNVIILLLGIILILSLVACSSAMEKFTTSFEAADYKEALDIYENDIEGNEDKQKELEDYLLPKAKENLEIYKNDPDYRDSKAEEILNNMNDYVGQDSEELRKVIREYNDYKLSRVAYTKAKYKLDMGEHEEAMKLFEEVLPEDNIHEDFEILNELIKEAEAEVEEKENRLAESFNKMLIKKDDVEGYDWYYDETSPEYIDVNNFVLYMANKQGSKSPFLIMSIRYHADKWLFIEGYTINVDGEVYTIKPNRFDIQRDHGGGKIWEWYEDEATTEQLEMIDKIIKSDSAIIRHHGKQYYDDREITSTEKQALQNVLDAYEYLKR